MTDAAGSDDHAQRRPKKYRLVRLPLWARGVVIGASFGGALFAYLRLSDYSASLLFDVISSGIAAVVFAMLLTLVARALERRIFDADGAPLNTDDRVRVLQAVDAGRWPQHERLQPAASRLVEQRLRRSEKPAFQMVVFGAMLALSVLNAMTEGPWWWCAVAFWLVAGPWSVLSNRRRRRSAQALRDRTFA